MAVFHRETPPAPLCIHGAEGRSLSRNFLILGLRGATKDAERASKGQSKHSTHSGHSSLGTHYVLINLKGRQATHTLTYYGAILLLPNNFPVGIHLEKWHEPHCKGCGYFFRRRAQGHGGPQDFFLHTRSPRGRLFAPQSCPLFPGPSGGSEFQWQFLASTPSLGSFATFQMACASRLVFLWDPHRARISPSSLMSSSCRYIG